MGMAVVNFHHAYSCCGDTLYTTIVHSCVHVMLTSRYSLPCHHVVLMSYSRVCVLVDDHVIFYINHRRDKVILHLFPPMCESVSLVLLSHAYQLQCRKFE